MIFKSEVLWFCILILIAICLIMCGLLFINKVSGMHEMKKYIDELNEEFKDVEWFNDKYEEPKH